MSGSCKRSRARRTDFWPRNSLPKLPGNSPPNAIRLQAHRLQEAIDAGPMANDLASALYGDNVDAGNARLDAISVVQVFEARSSE